MPKTYKSESLTVAVVTVCLESTVTAELLSFIYEMPWQVVSSSFQAYISESRRASFSPQLKAADACIAIVDFDADPVASAVTTSYLRRVFQERLTIIGLATAAESDLLLLAMRAGCSEFLHKPLQPSSVHETLKRMQDLWSLSAYKAVPVGSLLSLFGAKGGVGTTTLAVHLALYLVQNHQKRVLLIDLHPELGHVCVYLGLDGSTCSFYEVARNVNRLDSELLQSYTAKHSSGLCVLSSPDTCGEARHMDTNAITTMLEFLRNEFDFVIMDCPISLGDAYIASSTCAYLVATPEVGAIRDLSRYVDRFMHLEDTTDKIRIVVNRFPSPHTVNLEQMEKAIRMPVSVKFAASYAELTQAGNLGTPISPSAKSDFASNMSKWAASLVGSDQTSAPAKSFKTSFALWK